MRPDLALRSLSELRGHSSRLASELGINSLLFDKDNCVTLPRRFGLHHELASDWSWITGSFAVAILSNSAGSLGDLGGWRARRLETSLQVPVVPHFLCKPFCSGRSIRRYFSSRLNVAEPRIAVVGDRMLTDVLFGKLNGFYTILIDPIDPALDSLGIKVARRAERLLF